MIEYDERCEFYNICSDLAKLKEQERTKTVDNGLVQFVDEICETGLGYCSKREVYREARLARR